MTTRHRAQLLNLNNLADRLHDRLEQVQEQLEQVADAMEAIHKSAAELPHPYDVEVLADSARRVFGELDSIQDAWEACRSVTDDA